MKLTAAMAWQAHKQGVSATLTGMALQTLWRTPAHGNLPTRCANVNGLPDERQVTTARDLAKLARKIA